MVMVAQKTFGGADPKGVDEGKNDKPLSGGGEVFPTNFPKSWV